MLALGGAAFALPAMSRAAALGFSGADIDAAGFAGSDLPAGRSALTAKVQILLDRAGTSPGVTDGAKGAMSTSAIKAFQRRMGLPMNGILDGRVWAALQPYADAPATQDYTITDKDMENLVAEIPSDYLLKSNMVWLGYTSVAEKLAERFHMSENFIKALNPNARFEAGEVITVMAPGKPAKGKVTRIIIDKSTRRVAAYDSAGKMVVDYPATIGSDQTPSPSGHVHVTATAINPEYTYNPRINFQQGDNDQVLKIPPGPNGPVGTVWIALSKPTYGIHGTPTPELLFQNQSFGCVRLTNWDAEELAHLVRTGTTKVEFLEAGVSIADVTDPVAAPEALSVASAGIAGALSISARPPLRTAALADVTETATETAVSNDDAARIAMMATGLATGDQVNADSDAEQVAPETPHEAMTGDQPAPDMPEPAVTSPDAVTIAASDIDPLAAAIIAATAPAAEEVMPVADAGDMPALGARPLPRPPHRLN